MTISKCRVVFISLAAAMLMLGISAQSQAATILCGGPDRWFEMSGVASCNTGEGNATEPDVESYLGGNWTEVGEVTGSGATSPWFIVALTSGSWGNSAPITGTYSISPSFWSTYLNGAVSVHVGNGQGSPDHWVYGLVPGTLSGSWSYVANNANGGGLSNLKLFGNGVAVPEPSTVVLLGIGLAMLGLRRRRK